MPIAKGLPGFARDLYLRLLGNQRLTPLLAGEIAKSRTILDAACGYNSSIKFRTKDCYKVGLDHYRPYLLKSRESGYHDEYVQGEILALPFKSKSFDCVVATEVLEHLDKEQGRRLLAEVERVARKRVVMTTPNGFLPTYPGEKDNPDERHLSGWTVKELKGLGYRVYGLHGLKMFSHIREGRAEARPPAFLFLFLADLSQIFVYRMPGLAFGLLFVKDISDN